MVLKTTWSKEGGRQGPGKELPSHTSRPEAKELELGISADRHLLISALSQLMFSVCWGDLLPPIKQLLWAQVKPLSACYFLQ